MPDIKLTPNNTVFIVLSFEGPDGYALSGGLGTRVRGLTLNLARLGYTTHLFFVGDPNLPGLEKKLGGKLIIHRWCQWISRYHPNGVYDGEDNKVMDFNGSVPSYITDEIVRPAAEENKIVVVMAEEWHTAQTIINVSNHLFYRGLRDRAILMWNANNIYSFHRINWGALNFVSNITTVSKYMKHEMWKVGVNPTVVPNGIPDNFFHQSSSLKFERKLHEATGSDIILFKVGRFSPDKRWHMAIRAMPILKKKGLKTAMIMKGGTEPFGGEVFYEIKYLGLTVSDIHPKENTIESLAESMIAAPKADIYNIVPFLSENMLKPIYAESDAVLANSGHEPFGLVGLEVMACGGIPFLGSTGEDYAIPFKNSIVLETEDPREIVSYIEFLHRNPRRNLEIRKTARSTAKNYSWKNVIQSNLIARLVHIKEQQKKDVK
ncbi:MAG: glycosyltransferase family 4 protein [Elusimicrobia bacterium]|nr:glycosyltransferase family 4 protein [Elusimicrobiota bacterium]